MTNESWHKKLGHLNLKELENTTNESSHASNFCETFGKNFVFWEKFQKRQLKKRAITKQQKK